MDQDGLDDTTSTSPLLTVAGPVPRPVVLTFHDGGTTDPCAAVAGQDSDGDGMLSGGFGWLDIDESSDLPCKTEVFDGLVGADPGASPSTGCDKDDLANLLLGPEVAGIRQGTTVFIRSLTTRPASTVQMGSITSRVRVPFTSSDTTSVASLWSTPLH